MAVAAQVWGADPLTAVRRPGPPLTGVVSSINYLETTGHEGYERVLPGGGTVLMINLADDHIETYDAVAFGQVTSSATSIVVPRAEPRVINTRAKRHVTVTFVPGAAGSFFGIPLSAAGGERIALEAVWGRGVVDLRERVLHATSPDDAIRLVEAFLVGQAPHRPPPDPRLPWAAALLASGSSVAATREDVGMLARRFTTRFAEETGLTPKVFSRIQRLHRLLQAVPTTEEPDWAALAVTYGFFDQAHLINDFRSLTGLTPGTYASTLSRPFPNHVAMS